MSGLNGYGALAQMDRPRGLPTANHQENEIGTAVRV